MTRLTWDARDYEIGVDRGVFYPLDGAGEAWSGIISVKDTSVESTQRRLYQDGLQVANRQSSGFFAGTVRAYSYPPSFYTDILSQVRQKPVGFCYRTMTKTHYRLHLVYNVLFSPEGFSHEQSPVTSHSWGFTTLPIDIPGAKRSAHLIVETSIAYSWVIEILEDILYGTEGNAPRLPLPEEIVDIFETNAILQIIDNGDGTWTAIGPDSVVYLTDPDTFEISWPSAVYIDADSYTVSTL